MDSCGINCGETFNGLVVQCGLQFIREGKQV